MRRLLASMIVIGMTLAGTLTGHAQSYPTRPITIIVPFPAGALSDAAARILQPKLTEALGQSVIIENRGGAGGVIGAAQVARAQPDGYTLLVTVNAPVVMAPAIQKNYPFDPVKALSGVALLSETYLALVVRSESPIKSIADLIRLAKEKPGQLTFGSAGVGSAHQIAGGLLSTKAGISINHVPFQGGAPAVQALVGGHIDMSFATLPSVMPLVKDGRLRLVALAEPKRYDGMPDLPTISETVPGVVSTAWVGMFAPAGTPKDILERLYKILDDALRMPDVKEKMIALGMVPVPQGPAEFDRVIAEDLKFWRGAVETAKIEKQ
ncbi:tripartite tricarboxylate transporter substrate binding protein [Pseudorhodoplanes sp.]|uniref:Bug family tripartite tricarboxylate transporter substrate binding protein n=1 Tax=Pseudorhodoplanes sp. TaxID=1934341 RepID=UPI002BC83166|nr:tripartite tricarboxylate transporter substrate binding protein [Pseudorhodoplanes sp.]HWV53674.1 tripartite tricarboxylate transporter substrate binding protein [Pseudorhodoplanes sp.]